MSIAYVVDGVWTAIAIIGVCVSSWALADGFVDRQAQKRRGTNGLERLVIKLNLRGAHASFYLHTFFVILGIFAFTTATPAQLTPSYVGLVGGYIFVAASNVRAVGLNQIDRWRTRRGQSA